MASVESLQPLTEDIVRLVLRAPEFTFTPGQYVDLHVPGSDGARRSFSMANLPGDRLIKRYPGGWLSGAFRRPLLSIAVPDVVRVAGVRQNLRR